MPALWIILAVLSAFFAALVAIFGKIGLTKIEPTLATAVRAVVMTAFLAVVVLADRKMLNGLSQFDTKAWVFIILSGVAGALSWLSYFTALKLGPVSSVAALDRTSLVFVFILALLFLGEEFSLKVAIGVILMTIGAIFTIL